MKTKKVLHGFLTAAAAVSLILILLLSAFEIAAYSDFGFYQKEYEKYEIQETLPMEMDDIMDVTEKMMSYLRGDREELSVMTTIDGERQDFFNEQDRFHMGEVRDLFIGGLDIRTGSCIAAVLCLVFLLVTRADIRKIIPRSYQAALGVSAAAAAFIGIASVIDFNAVFVRFHHIFFDNDQWIFDPATDYMIRMLPEGLFYDFVIRIGGIFLGILAVLLVASLIPGYLRKKKKSD